MRYKILAIWIVILLVLGCIGCTASSPSDSTPPHLVLTISGMGDQLTGIGQKTSQTFRISKGEWHIKTMCQALDSAGPLAFTAIICPEGESFDSPNILDIIQMTSSGPDTNYLHKKGNFYIKVIVMNVKSWTIEVYE